jgi:hypothetical protein
VGALSQYFWSVLPRIGKRKMELIPLKLNLLPEYTARSTLSSSFYNSTQNCCNQADIFSNVTLD